jgi:ion channel-forming bestrophin family protein
MIVYESNKNWLKDVRHLYKSWTMQRVIRSTLAVAGITAIICFVWMYVLRMEEKGLDGSIFSLLGVVLSILLSFRTTTAYERWWEGRKAWGDLVNNCRNLAIYIQSTWPIEDKKNRLFFAVQISNFCISLKDHLRTGATTDDLIGLEEDEKKLLSEKDHMPAHLALAIIAGIQEAYNKKLITNEDHLNIKMHSQELMNIAGKCERIKKTPIPFSYNVYLKLFITLYTMCMPFALMPIFGYWSILMVAFVFFAFIGLELMAEEIEDPFGLDCNDLPIADIAHTIKNNVFEILDVRNAHKEAPKEIYSKVF